MATRLKEVEPEFQPVAPAPALGYSITANLGDDRQIVTQCFADSEEPLASIHAKVDKAMAIIDRQKAKYRKAELQKNVDEMEATLRRLKTDLAASETDYEHRQKDTAAAIELIQSDAYQRGRAQPVGGDAQRLKALKADQEKAAEERKLARGHAATNITRFEEEIAKHKSQIEECDALIAGG